MAPLPFNNTDILFVDYATQGFPHQVQCRYASPNTYVDAMDSVAEWLTALAPEIGQTDILGARYQLEGTNVSVDVTWTGSASYGSGSGSTYQSAMFFDYIGRSPGGRRVRAAMFGAATLQFGENYRASVGENANLDAALDVLLAAEGTWLAIDGTQPIWKQYTNMGVNAYWRNKIR